MSDKILFVDDDPSLLSAMQRSLRRQFEVEVAPGPREALTLLTRQGGYAVIVADMTMPGMDGLTLLEHIARLAPDTVRVMLTGNADQRTAVGAINRTQVFRYLNKPCPPETLVPVLQEAIRQHVRVRSERSVLEGTLTQCINTLVEVIGMTVPEAHQQGQCLRECVRAIAESASLNPVWELEMAALLSPIGLASLPLEVVRKLAARQALRPDEGALLRRMPKVGHDLLASIPRMETVAQIILYQDKQYDGRGFPDDLCRHEEIPVGARLLKILRDRLALEAEGKVGPSAETVMKDRVGAYDPMLLEACFARFPAMLRKVTGDERPPLALSISELLPGHRLHQQICTAAGLVVVAKGHTLTAVLIERLRNLIEIGEVREPFLICDTAQGNSNTAPASAALVADA